MANDLPPGFELDEPASGLPPGFELDDGKRDLRWLSEGEAAVHQ